MTAEDVLIQKRVVVEFNEPGEWRSRDGTGNVRGRISRVIPMGDDHGLVVSLEKAESFKWIFAPRWMQEEYGIRTLGEMIVKQLWLIGRYEDDRTLDILTGNEIYVNIAAIPPRVDVSSSRFNPRRDLVGLGHGIVRLVI
ncbi:MAG: hypothetical protein QXU73_05050 [Thermoplasmata archaeon]